MVEAGAYPRDEFMADLDRFLSDRDERKLFGLPPREAEGVKIVGRARKRSGYMTRKQLIDRVAESWQGKLSKKDVGAVVAALFGLMGRAVCEDGRFAWSGFGTLRVMERAARRGRHPGTGEEMVVKARKTVIFRPAQLLTGSL